MFDKKKVAMPPLGKDSQTPFAEAYKALRTNLDYYAANEDVHTVLFASPEADSDKCTFIRNLAITLTATDHSVMLADFDLRGGELTTGLKITAEHPGVSDVLTGKVEVTEAMVHGQIDGVDVLPSGVVCTDPAALFSNDKTADLLSELKKEYDFVLLNTPSVDEYTDVVVLSRIVDATVLLLAAGTTHMPAAQKCKEKLEMVNAKILGAVLTNYDPKQI